MNEDGNHPGSPFLPTRWSLVERAGHPSQPGGRVALNEILVLYHPPLLAHLIRRRGLPPDRAEDLLQAFIAKRILEKKLLRKADRNRGKFRTFLLTSLDRFVSNELRAERTKRRGGGRVQSLEDHPMFDAPGAQPLPADVFDVEWARQVTHEAVRRMRKECDRKQRDDMWGVFEWRVLKPAMEGATPMHYEELIQRFSLKTPEQASSLLVNAKRMFVRHLREVVGEYVQDPQGIDEELLDLKQVLARGGQTGPSGCTTGEP